MHVAEAFTSRRRLAADLGSQRRPVAGIRLDLDDNQHRCSEGIDQSRSVPPWYPPPPPWRQLPPPPEKPDAMGQHEIQCMRDLKFAHRLVGSHHHSRPDHRRSLRSCSRRRSRHDYRRIHLCKCQ